MKIDLPETPVSIKCDITRPTKPIKSIVGFVAIEIIGKDDKPIFKVRGATIKVINREGTSVFIVDAPAYRSGHKYVKSFIVEDVKFWKEITEKVMQNFSELTGGLSAEECLLMEGRVNPEEVPI